MNSRRLIEYLQLRDDDIHVQADITIDVDDTKIRCRGDGQRLSLGLQSLGDLRSIYLKRGPGLFQVLEKAVVAMGLTIEVNVSDRVILTVGKQATPGILSYCSDLEQFQVHFGAFLQELLKDVWPFSSRDS